MTDPDLRELNFKIERLTALLENQSKKPTSLKNKDIVSEIFLGSLLSSIMGFFLFRIMDHYFGGK